MPNTCSEGKRLSLLHGVHAAEDTDMAAPRDARLKPLPLQWPLGLHGPVDVLSGGGDGSAVPAVVGPPEVADGAYSSGEVGVYASPLSATQRNSNPLSRGLLGCHHDPTPTVVPDAPGTPPSAQESIAAGSTVAATTIRLPASSAPSPFLLAEGKPNSSIPVPNSRGSNLAAGCRADPLPRAADESGATSRGSSADIARTCAGAVMEGVYGRHYADPMLQSRRGQSGGSSDFFHRGADGDDDEDGSAAFQAAVDAAVRFDDLSSEDDSTGGGSAGRRLRRADPTPLSHMLSTASDSGDGSLTRAHSGSVDLVGPFDMPGRRSDGNGERRQLHSPLTPDTQQRGCGGERSTGGRPEMVDHASLFGHTYPPLSSVAAEQRAAIGAADTTYAATALSLPYFSAPGSTNLSPRQAVQPRTSPAAAAATSPTAIATTEKSSCAAAQVHQLRQQLLYPYAVTSARVKASSSIPTSSTSLRPLSMPVSSAMSGVPPQQQQHHHHHQRSSLSQASPHGSKAPPTAVTHAFPAGATAMATQGDADSFRFVSPLQASVVVSRPNPTVSGTSMGGGAAAQNSAEASLAILPGTGDSGAGAGVAAQTSSNSLLSSPGPQSFHLYQVPQAAVEAEPQQQQQGSASVLLYSPPQAYLGSGQVALAHLRPAPSSPASATAVLGDSTRPRSTSPPNVSYCLPPVTQQQQQQVIGGYTLTPTANASAAAAAVAAAAAPSEESGRASRNLYLRNLPHSWNTRILRELCSRYGAVLSAKVAHHPTTNESLGYGFVLFEHKQSAMTCMAMLNQAHVHAEGEEPRTLLVRMAHATAAPGFQEEGVGESAVSGLRKSMEPLTSGSASRAGASGGRLPQWVTQQQQPPQQPASRLRSPRTSLSDSASAILLSLSSAAHFHSRELSGVSMGETYRGHAHRHSIADSIKANANTSSNTSGAGGDSLRCTSPVGGAGGSSSSVAISRTSMPSSFPEACSYTSPKGAARASVPPLRGLYHAPSANATPSPLSPTQKHHLQLVHQPPPQEEGSLSYSSTSATMSVPAGATVAASAMTAVEARCTGYSFSSPPLLSPNDTGSLLRRPSSVPHSPVQLPQSFHAPSASVPTSASSRKVAPSASASATTSTRNVYITNLPLTWNTTKLRELCSQYGEIVSASVAHHPKTNESRGYGFVLFVDERDAASCVMTLHQYRVPNSPNVLCCRFAKEKATPSIAHALLSPSQEPGFDSGASGNGSSLLATAAGGLSAAATSQTTVPLMATGDSAEVFDSSAFSTGGDSSTNDSVEAAIKGAVCMPIDVFCTLQQRVRAQCAQHLAQQQQQRRATGDGSEPTGTVAVAEAPSEEIEMMMRCCVVYGTHVPASGYGCVRPLDCLGMSSRRTATRFPTAAEVDGAAELHHELLAGPPTLASSGQRSVGSLLSAECGDPRLETAGALDTAASPSLLEAVVCTHAIPVGRTQPVSPAAAGIATMQAASSREGGISVAPSREQPHGVDMTAAESVGLIAAPGDMISPVASQELWYTCTLFTTPSASDAFVQAAAEAAPVVGATVDTEHDDVGTGGGSVAGTLAVHLSSHDKDAPPAGDKAANAPQMRFGRRDQVMVLSSALSAGPADTPSTTANSTHPPHKEGSHTQQRPPVTPPQQQRHSCHQCLRPSHVVPPPTLPHTQARDVSAAASATRPGGPSFFLEAGLAATPMHPSTFTPEPAEQLLQSPHRPRQQQQPMLCSPTSADLLLRSLPSPAAHYTYPLATLSSPTAGASLTSPISMMLTGGGGDGSGNSAVAPLSFSPDLVSSASAAIAGGWHPSASTADCAYLLGSPASSSSINLSAGTHILSGAATPQPSVGLNTSNMPSAYSAMLNTAGLVSPPGTTASAAHAHTAVFASPSAHAWTAFIGSPAAPMASVLGSPPPAGPLPISSPGQAPPPPPHIPYPFGGVIYAMPAAALSATATGGPPVLLSASPTIDAAGSATSASLTQVPCTSPNATPQRFAQPLRP
ncbi:hypothetical protein LSCM1_07985 [Leishmania martiniquensis]|uniref:RRM domain-containing protein n=1 Tax=Leishmania martiniquensis TaxID=1580590 RepID=A0A836HYK4_9TRYP|nr:hypothetical protein LSCM1_07985 [Leishmania martiniquensis]